MIWQKNYKYRLGKKKNRNSHDKMEKLISFNMHVQYPCSVESCIFVQCWPGIFFCAMSAKFEQKLMGHLQQPYIIKKNNRSKIKIIVKWQDGVQTTLHRIFSCVMLSGALGQFCRFFLCSIVPRVLGNITQHFFFFFLRYVVSSLSDNIA